MKYYARTLAGLLLLVAVIVIAALLANRVATGVRERHARLSHEAAGMRTRRRAEVDGAARLQRAMEPVREFAAGWQPYARAHEKEAAETIRSDIEAIAQRQLGLVTDNAITPQPDRHVLHGRPMRVQRVTLRASGRDLAALLAWLGRVEERYPAALVEWCEFSSNVGGNTGLTVRIVQPLRDPAALRATATATPAERAQLSDTIASVRWRHYLPSRVKGAVPVGLQRNPLQPAIAADARTIAPLRDEGDELSPRLDVALEGRLRSVIRGVSPLIVVEGRIFRIGDELTVGANRERPIPDAKTKLKHIGDDHLTFHVAGLSAGRQIQCEIAYSLPVFLKAR